MALPEGAAELYGLPVGEFVAARTALAKQLRAEKRREEAAAVSALRKPTVASWALDQVARSQPALVAAALEAGDALLAATGRAMEGDASDLQDASAADRAASGAVLKAAASLLGGDPGAHRDRMAATLRAAVLDPEVRAHLEAGTLAADHEPPATGFGDVGTMAGVEPAPRARSTSSPRPPAARTTPKVGQRTDELAARRAARAEREAERAQSDEQQRLAEQRAAEVRAAEERAAEERADVLQALRAAADAARRAADAAVQQADDAAARAEQAQARAAQAAHEADAARAQADEAALLAESAEAAVTALEEDAGG